MLKTEPAWETLPGDVTAAVSAVLRRCLEKEPFQRMRDIADVRMGLHGAFDYGAFDYAGRPAVDARRASGWGRRALELVGAAAVAGLGVWLLQPSAPREPVRFAIAGAPGMGPFVELSPDGRHLAYLEGDETGRSRIRLHSLASGEARQVSDTARAGTPLFWSPDSRFVGFGDGRTLRRVDAATGVVEPVCDTLVFNGRRLERGRRHPVRRTQRDHAGGRRRRGRRRRSRRWTPRAARSPTPHPGSSRTAVTSSTCAPSLDSSTGGIYVGALGVEPAEQDPTRLLATERPAVYGRSRGSTTGHLFFMQGSRLLAQPFRRRAPRARRRPTVVAEEVGSYDVRWRSFSVSRTGIIAWRDAPAGNSVRWIDPTGEGREAERIRGLDDPRHPRLSPDGNRLALVEAGDVWVFQLDDDRPPIQTHVRRVE